MVCACEIIQLVSVEFCVDKAVRKFDFGLTINRKKKNLSLSDRDSCSDRIYFFSPQPSSRVEGDSTQAERFNCILLSKGHLLVG